MEQATRPEPTIETPTKHYTEVPKNWINMTDEQKDNWAEEFLIDSGMFPKDT